MNASEHVVCPGCTGVNRVPDAKLGDQPRCGHCHQLLFQGQPVALRADTFDTHVGRTDLPVVVDFWAPWCGPCHAMAPIFEQATSLLEPDIRLAKLDTEAWPAIAARFGIRSIPTLILFQNGREVARQNGAMPLKALLSWIRSKI